MSVAFVLAALTVVPASAQWAYSVETDETGLEYASIGVSAPESGASIYTECTEKLGMGLALILGASPEMVERLGGAGGQVLYMNEAGDSAITTVTFKPGENRLTLATPERESIEAAWGVFARATEVVAARFTFPPEEQVYEVRFPVDGAREALVALDAYCR